LGGTRKGFYMQTCSAKVKKRTAVAKLKVTPFKVQRKSLKKKMGGEGFGYEKSVGGKRRHGGDQEAVVGVALIVTTWGFPSGETDKRNCDWFHPDRVGGGDLKESGNRQTLSQDPRTKKIVANSVAAVPRKKRTIGKGTRAITRKGFPSAGGGNNCKSVANKQRGPILANE